MELPINLYAEAAKFLHVTGHVRYPFGQPADAPNFPVTDGYMQSEVMKNAVRSYQALHLETLSDLTAKHHGRSPHVDGELGPATIELMTMARCGHPDYDETSRIAAAQGSGNWRGCWDIGNYHCAKVKFKTAIPTFLNSIWTDIWGGVVDAYADVGLMLVRDDQATKPQIEVSFVNPSGNWIGLAIVGGGQTCQSSPIWAQFDKNFRPSELLKDWTSLLLHEFGHNCGLQHSNGGIMNAVLIRGLSGGWKTDVSRPLLSTRFGGERVPFEPPTSPRKMVFAYQYGDGKLEYISDVPKYTGGGTFPTSQS